MKFKSTRGNSPELTASEAILQGLAPDGGLYVPEVFPQIDWKNWNDSVSYSEIASEVISPFFEDDRLQKYIPQICKSAFNFPVVLKNIQDEFSILELFHGAGRISAGVWHSRKMSSTTFRGLPDPQSAR